MKQLDPQSQIDRFGEGIRLIDEPSSNMVLLETDRSGKLLSTSSAFERRFGVCLDKNDRRNIRDIVAPVHIHLLNELFETNDSTQTNVARIQLLSNEGKAYWVEFSVRISACFSRFIVAFVECPQPITTVDPFSVSTTEWTYALDSFDEPIYVLDLNDRLVRANSAFYELKKLTPEQAIGKLITDIMHPKGETNPCPVCLARQRREDTYIVMEPTHPNNSLGVPFEVMVRTIRNEKGEPIGTLMGNRNLSRARQAESELRLLNQHVHLLLESTGEGIFGVDTQLRCTFINQAAANMLGFERNELLNNDVHEFVHHSYENGNYYPRSLSPILRTINEGISITTDNEVLWEKGGKSFPVHYSVNPILVDGKVTGAVIVFRNVTEARAMVRRMDYLATHDPLTGLVNRLEFEERLDSLIQRSHHYDEKHILCYMDLDQFKIVNDTCGHVSGDALLRQISSLLKEKIRRVDTLARLGGDEFGVLLQNCPLDQALRIVNHLRETVREFRFIWSDKVFTIGVSIGVVAIDSSVANRASVLSAADAACYLAKESGRNRVHVYQSDDEALVRRHGEMQWVTRIQVALEEQRFELYYQTIKPLSRNTQNLCFEFLVRMRDESGQLVPPGAFISAAERYDLMPAIDRWVIYNALQWLKRKPDVLKRIEFCTINISAISLSDEQFVRFIIDTLKETGIAANKICLELTETAAVSNLDRVIDLIRELRNIGCLFALDDFGSGMSSFTYLKNLPVDFLKIDGNFIRDIIDDPIDHAMVQAINQVGQVMGLRTIAEFVESEHVADKIAKMGINFAQGFHIAKPRPLSFLEQSVTNIETC